MKSILLVIEIETHFVELSRVARLLQKSGRYKPILWFKYPYRAIERDLKICQTEEWEYIRPLPISNKDPGIIQQKRGYFVSILHFSQSEPFLRSFVNFMLQVHQYKLQARQMRRLLVKTRPQLLIMAEDNFMYGLHTLIKIGNTLSIPTVIIPFTIANATEPAAIFFDIPDYIVSNNNLRNKAVGSLFPKWVYCYKGRKLLCFPWMKILALELLGFAPRQPWIYNSEVTSKIAVENEHMFQYDRNEGFPSHRLIITGALSDDILEDGLRNEETYRATLYKELDLTPNQPLLVCALPPSQFPRNCEFDDYPELVRFWMQTLISIKGWNVIIKPHPRLDKEEIDFLKQFGVKITLNDTARLVPLCDLFVASVSATIRWAIACGKPVVNYDVYQVDWADYVDAHGVITINDKDSFANTIKYLTSNQEFYDTVATRQKECMSKWGLLDGKSGERMLNFFNDVIQNSKERH